MKITLLILFTIFFQLKTFSQSLEPFEGDLNSVNTIIGYTFPFGDNHLFEGNIFYKNDSIDSLSVSYENKGHDEVIDAHYQVFHQYLSKFNSEGALAKLDAKYLYNDGIDIYVDHHFIMSANHDTTNFWYSGHYGHIMPDTTLNFKIEPFNFDEALKKVGDWWSNEYETNREQYIQN